MAALGRQPTPIGRDWGEAQGNYDAFRLFSGLRPSEEIALVVQDFDPVRRAVTVSKARVAGIDEDSTKTGAIEMAMGPENDSPRSTYGRSRGSAARSPATRRAPR